jgi:hypothetical protein
VPATRPQLHEGLDAEAFEALVHDLRGAGRVRAKLGALRDPDSVVDPRLASRIATATAEQR